ncbi:uncharacterized protein LOC126905650 isoform X2 [Daktulosphaira vitifoliae]|uniref:uncharacterized protein LOC126905650 isoform X2 n=1 Tax=Daktulosphaira vitifoliae TaxID=58002 RepID=UPI0021A9D038|nr:uncharacterized protein LOC126905650 isoform X2 [Daktulosphaira vitifoliae]
MFFYRHNSVTAQGLFKILNCMVKVDKWGDNKDVAKMDINNVEDISNKFKDFDIDTDGFLNKKEISEFIKHFELSSLTRNELTQEDYGDVIYEFTHLTPITCDLSQVMLILLEYKAIFDNKEIDKIKDFNDLIQKVYEISQGHPPENFKSFHEE